MFGVDNLNDYYDIRLKEHRLNILKHTKGFKFQNIDIEEKESVKNVFDNTKFRAVINLAARAGVRYSLIDPLIYVRTNVSGTVNLLELCVESRVDKFVMASTSSLYAGQEMPFKEDLPVNEPISPYAAY